MDQYQSKPFPIKASKTDRIVFHVDMDAFYAAIERLEHPEYGDRPLIVGGVESSRGVVSSASYAARAYGIHSAMPITRAKAKCPHGLFVPVRPPVYAEYSARLMACLSEFSPLVEQVSVDEAFLDMTGSQGQFGDPLEAGRLVKDFIRTQLKLTASVGIAGNKFLAKLASDARKPDGLFWVKPDGVGEFLDPLPVSRLWGVGKKTVSELHRLGLYTINQLRLYPLSELRTHLGDTLGPHLHQLARGADSRELVTDWKEKSISHERTFERDCGDEEILVSVLLDLSDRIARRARKEGVSGRTVSLVWRDPDFSRHSRSKTLGALTRDSGQIYEVAFQLFKTLNEERSHGEERALKRRKFRLLGIRLSNFEDASNQLDLFGTGAEKAKPTIDLAMDAVRDRFGEKSISRGRLIKGEWADKSDS